MGVAKTLIESITTGQTVSLPAGTYVETEPINWPISPTPAVNCVVQGAGADDTILDFSTMSGYAYCLQFSKTHSAGMGVDDKIHHVEFRNLQIKGMGKFATSTADLVRFDGECNNIKLTNCKINDGLYGVRLSGVFLDQITLDGCVFARTLASAVLGNCHRLKVRRGYFDYDIGQSGGDHAIYLGNYALTVQASPVPTRTVFTLDSPGLFQPGWYAFCGYGNVAGEWCEVTNVSGCQITVASPGFSAAPAAGATFHHAGPNGAFGLAEIERCRFNGQFCTMQNNPGTAQRNLRLSGNVWTNVPDVEYGVVAASPTPTATEFTLTTPIPYDILTGRYIGFVGTSNVFRVSSYNAWTGAVVLVSPGYPGITNGTVMVGYRVPNYIGVYEGLVLEGNTFVDYQVQPGRCDNAVVVGNTWHFVHPYHASYPQYVYTQRDPFLFTGDNIAMFENVIEGGRMIAVYPDHTRVRIVNNQISNMLWDIVSYPGPVSRGTSYISSP